MKTSVHTRAIAARWRAAERAANKVMEQFDWSFGKAPAELTNFSIREAIARVVFDAVSRAQKKIRRKR